MHALTLVTSALTLAMSATAFTFVPENLTILAHSESALPKIFDISASQTIPESDASWYSTSYVRSQTNGHQYFIVSHTIPVLPDHGSGFYRSSILDVTNPTVDGAYWQNVTIAPTPSGYNNGSFNITYPGGVYAFESLSEDSVAVLHTKQIDPSLSFDITFQSSSPLILNGGLGGLAAGITNGKMPNISTEWSMPAGVTWGSFSWNGTNHEIDGANSFTWYDRQWGGDAPKNWTWFGLHVGPPGDEAKSTKMSFWAIDQANSSVPRTQFGTIRKADGIQMVVPATFSPSDDIWTSPTTGYEYPQQYSVTWPDGSTMEVASARQDQELSGPILGSSGYEGYGTVSGKFLGETITGFGVIEVTHFTAPP
ncbi:hypothetical protein CALVIDRAFT_368390 [Calocera viscosa TUFC12733]|uniref:AttH domain-containing protein n=1 Tax=Calocera viscosa (strain TUFC12733) TaxID=1330018 RepID=A0A167GZH5_CALVF|nr:hypothetical protein CALVIDRAFT_368390 [Calocera viscosa TUFC12733]